MFKQWKERRIKRDSERVSHWIVTGMADYKMGVGPHEGPFAYKERAFHWWLCGWTMMWVERGETDVQLVRGRDRCDWINEAA